jgi:hypothetical protein
MSAVSTPSQGESNYLPQSDARRVAQRIRPRYHGAPLKHARIAGSQVVLRGVMHKGVDLPFEITPTIALDPDGRVRLHPTKTRILGIDGAKLMRALGLRLDKRLDIATQGVSPSSPTISCSRRHGSFHRWRSTAVCRRSVSRAT